MITQQPINNNSENVWIRLNYIYLLLILIGASFIITAAMFLQYTYHELPCPLCLLQRLAFFGICFGIILSFRDGYSIRHMGFSMLFTLFLLIVSTRQSLLDIVPRPGHEWIGSPIFGIHLPVWSIIISLILLVEYAVKLIFLKEGDFMNLANIERYPLLRTIAYAFSWYLIILCAINVVSIFLQCGLYICHTFNYRLLI